ncbi:Fe2+/Zn2+ uptake regulation protein [Rubrobacter radiotolerans]|uniref:Fe2+/Zn2+ uptake regulation protein n=1 Tax=Rubrobacter radiotolerans TaxID=42256 RepID=A0A023X782_RUBRA|nr:Fur family transcriptional regulator [Rubrobacter radiotolerans]AHY47924.1 Fe2+/Zn2+ uptake regulation protein [Rubrobacter radiotolerans]MDX5892563.1 Fur family transcriptional regulator [Rubrobacter radiotolerans]SMC07852.1 Fur family transcriptional regulator, ferric uptake regulator [Rubrobacter radiotolerans DSM 5868]
MTNEAPFRVLQERGIRVTPQRAHVWRVLVESGDHFTAEEVWERASESLPGLELSTVYRALEALGAAGLVADSRLPEGPRIFEAKAHAHPHLVCVSCGRILHPDPAVGARLVSAIEAAAGDFAVQELHVSARGLCGSCASGE